MPKAYTSMRDRFKREGLSDSAAKTKAAKIYNAGNPNQPVGPSYHEGPGPKAPKAKRGLKKMFKKKKR